MENYNIIFPKSRGLFVSQLSDADNSVNSFLAEELKQGRRLAYSKVFLSDIRNQYAELTASSLYTNVLSQAPCSIVGQSPLNGCKTAVLVKTTDLDESLTFHSMRLTEEEAFQHSSYLQTLSLFNKYIDYLKENNLDMSTHLVRTWIYITDIDVNYNGVVKARNDIFRQYGLTADTHYVASTGIGGDSQSGHACVAIDFLTYPDIEEKQKTYLKAPEHLNPTHEYGVAFERATRLNVGSTQHFYVSGTASIDCHGSVLHIGDVEKQAARLIENISALLANGNATLDDVRYFIVYLRDISDFNAVDAIFRKRFPNIPYVIVQAKVCRPEWLIEAECIAEKP